MRSNALKQIPLNSGINDAQLELIGHEFVKVLIQEKPTVKFIPTRRTTEYYSEYLINDKDD